MTQALGVPASVVLNRLHEADLDVVFAVAASSEAESEQVKRVNAVLKGMNMLIKALSRRA